MRIALTNATTWPYVRRGVERLINELACYLGKRGHDVHVISAKPGSGEVRKDFGYVTRLHRRWWHPALGRIGVLEVHAFMLSCLPRLLESRYDVILSCSFLDSCAATIARRITGTPNIYLINSLATPMRYVRSLSAGGRIHCRVIAHVDEVIAASGFDQTECRRRYGRLPVVLHPPVDTERFAPRSERYPRPTIVCASSLDDARKGGLLLMRSFNRLKKLHPDATLQIASHVSERCKQGLMRTVESPYRNDVEFIGDGQIDDLARVYARAWVVVLPSLWETFGMVLVEALASGTPVVGTQHGGIPEIVTDPSIGRLFDPGDASGIAPTNVEGLTTALMECLALSGDPGVAQKCRDHAQRFSWDTYGQNYENLLLRIASSRKSVGVARTAKCG